MTVRTKYVLLRLVHIIDTMMDINESEVAQERWICEHFSRVSHLVGVRVEIRKVEIREFLPEQWDNLNGRDFFGDKLHNFLDKLEARESDTIVLGMEIQCIIDGQTRFFPENLQGIAKEHRLKIFVPRHFQDVRKRLRFTDYQIIEG